MALLQLGQNSLHYGERFFRDEAVDLVAQADFDPTVPEPADAHVD